MELKYILGENGNFAIFSKANTHSEMARGFYGKPVSAGFCQINIVEDREYMTSIVKHTLHVECYGESISLHLKSRNEDSEIITRGINSIY